MLVSGYIKPFEFTNVRLRCKHNLSSGLKQQYTRPAYIQTIGLQVKMSTSQKATSQKVPKSKGYKRKGLQVKRFKGLQVKGLQVKRSTSQKIHKSKGYK